MIDGMFIMFGLIFAGLCIDDGLTNISRAISEIAKSIN